MNIGILKEASHENRVSLSPDCIPGFKKLGVSILLESSAGVNSSYPDSEYSSQGAEIKDRKSIFAQSEILLSIHPLSKEEFSSLKPNQILIGMYQPVYNKEYIKEMNQLGITVMSLDSIPRITRAQSMDILSSQAAVSGYKAVLLAASNYPKFFPMLTTAAGTITPAKVLVLGAGVAGLQAIATSRRLGAVVDVFDTRPEVKEQVQSLGAKFVDVEGSVSSASAGGYAVEQNEEYKKRQAEAIFKFASKADVIISTALIPGKKAPILIPKSTVDEMKPGSIIIDLASAMGGNCELTKDREYVNYKGITIYGNSNLQSTVPMDASKMYSKNILNYCGLLFQDKQFKLNLEDEIVSAAVITNNKEIRHKATKEALGI
jgi:NAD(P) transhydrogenase subunit alpha